MKTNVPFYETYNSPTRIREITLPNIELQKIPKNRHSNATHNGHLKAVILAGGKHSRFFPLQKPKVHLQIGGVPLINFTLSLLKDNKINDVTIICNQHDKEYYKDHKKISPIAYNCHYEEDDCGTGNSLRALQKEMYDFEDIILINPGILCSIDLPQIIEHHIKNKCIFTIAFINNKKHPSEETIILRQNETIKRMNNYNPYINGNSLLIPPPIILFNKVVLNYIPKKIYVDFKEDVLLDFLRNNCRLTSGIEVPGNSLPVFSFPAFLEINKMLSDAKQLNGPKTQRNSPDTEHSSTEITDSYNQLKKTYSRKFIRKLTNHLDSLTKDTNALNGPILFENYHLNNPNIHFGYYAIKRSSDIVFSSLLLFILAPLFFLLAILIKVDSRGPVFFIQKRYGLNGKIFNLLKFRTMKMDAEKQLWHNPEYSEEYSRKFKIKNDSRITRIGSFLRKYSLDEIPQFLNVLLGSMSFAGPRPIVKEEERWYGIDFKKFLSVKPGLTSLWVIKGRNFVSYPHRANIELDYINRRSTLLDFKLILKTIPCLLRYKSH